jgi:membrane protein YqaA with SNARE-associated domain
MENFFQSLLVQLSDPNSALALLFIVSLLAATLVPLGSEPLLLGLLTLQPDLLWPALGVVTLGNTLGGVVGWWMGRSTGRWMAQRLDPERSARYARALRWLEKLGPAACLGAWLPVVGDPLCVLAGYLRLPLLPCAAYMAVGKGLRYLGLVFGWQWLMGVWPWS